jgi:hypothetical protein
LSVEADHDRDTDDGVVAVTARLDGAVGACVSGGGGVELKADALMDAR